MKDIFGPSDDQSVEIVEETVAAPSTSKLRSMFKHYLDNCETHRADAFRDRRYFDGEQIGDAWRKRLEADEMPLVPINLIKDQIQAHIGLVSAQQTEVRAFPRTQAAAPAAETATKLLRYAIDSAKIENKINDAAANFFVEGVGALLIECDAENIYSTQIDFRDFAYDPNSRRSDFSDAKWMGFSRWLPAGDIADAYPEAYARLAPSGDGDLETLGTGFDKDTTDNGSIWINSQKLIRVIEIYYLEGGEWQFAVWCHAGVLDFGPSPYTDDRGVSVCPLIPAACHTMADPNAGNHRYGEVRALVYPQDDYNARRHAALKGMMTKKVYKTDAWAEPVDSETLRAEARKREIVMPDGYDMTTLDVSAEQYQFMQLASQEIARMSPSAAVTGANLPADASGRSRQLAAAGGRLSLTPVLNRVQDWRENIYRHVWYRINQYWRAQMEVRITGNVNAPKFLSLNVPIVEEVEEPIVDPQTGQPMVNPYTGAIATQRVAKVVGIENEVARMDMDLMISTTEKHNDLEQEVWDSLMQMMSSLQITFGTPEFRLAMEWYPIPNRTEVIERYDSMVEKMKADSAESDQMQQQLAQMQAQISLLMDKSKADKDASTAAVNTAKAERTQIETAMLTDNHNQQQELQAIIAQQLFRG